jgi:hypothetical protein
MKKPIVAIVCLYLFCGCFCSCSIFHKEKYGCPDDPKAIGAERLASGDPAAAKLARKAKKFRQGF